MLILGIILFGIFVGGIAQLVVRQSFSAIDWPVAFGTGLVGSFVGGLLVSLLSGDGLALRPSGVIGSIVGAIILTVAWDWWQGRTQSS